MEQLLAMVWDRYLSWMDWLFQQEQSISARLGSSSYWQTSEAVYQYQSLLAEASPS